jgi:hypothetical protein
MNERKIIEDLMATMRLAARRAAPLIRARIRKAILDAEAALADIDAGKKKKKTDQE